MPWYAYVFVLLIGGTVGIGELVSRYTDEPQDAIRSVPALVYLLINGVAALVALVVIDALGWTFGADEGPLQLILQIFVAGFGAMAVLRSAVFTVRVGDSDVQAGPIVLVTIILDAADRAVDRRRAQRRSRAVQAIMRNVDFNKAKAKLPSHCWSLMQNVTQDQKDAAMETIWGCPGYAELSIAGFMQSSGLCGVDPGAPPQVPVKPGAYVS